MPFKFNPFSGNFDQTGSGGGGASYIDGEVQNFSALPQTVGSPAVDSAYLVREAEGTWLLNRKPAGIYIRTGNSGVRASDWTYAGEFPDVFSDANLVIYNGTDSTKNVKFDASAIATGTTRTITVPDANITLDDASDSRTPTAHAASHAAAGSDPLAPSDIGAQSLFTTTTLSITADTNLSAARATIYNVSVGSAGSWKLIPATTGSIAGDVIIVFHQPIGSGNALTFTNGLSPSGIQTIAQNERYRFVYSGSVWQADPVYTHTHAASAITSGTLDIARIPTGTSGTQVALGNHTHTPSEVGLSNLSNVAQVTSVTGTAPIVSSGGTTPAISVTVGTGANTVAAGDDSRFHTRSHAITSTSDHTAGNHKVFYSNGSGEIVELALGSSGTVLTSNGATSAPSFAAASGGIAAIGASAADILSVSGSDLVADDPNADRLVFWDDSAGALKYLTAGSGLTITDTTITASGGVGGSSGSVDNAILRADGTGGSTSQGSAFVIADNATASPNNTVNHASIQATGDTANVSVSIVPKGTGALSLHVPDGTSTGGNTRGTRACDFQRSRSTAAQVASGQDSFIAGGNGSTASGNFSFIGGGDGNVASGSSSAVIGSWLGTASSNRATVISSYFSTASQEQAAVINGNSSSATQTHALAVGHSAVADAACLIAEGFGAIGATGSSQALRYMLRGTTTTNSAVELQGGPNANVRLRCPSGKVMFMNIMIVGVSNGGGTVATFQRQYAIKNISGTTSEIYAPVTIGTDSAASTSITVDANDTNDALRIQCTGLSATTIRWVAHISAVEVAHG